jgi:hypothetical protein
MQWAATYLEWLTAYMLIQKGGHIEKDNVRRVLNVSQSGCCLSKTCWLTVCLKGSLFWSIRYQTLWNRNMSERHDESNAIAGIIGRATRSLYFLNIQHWSAGLNIGCLILYAMLRVLHTISFSYNTSEDGYSRSGRPFD